MTSATKTGAWNTSFRAIGMIEMSEQARCEICGEPMPVGEEMFKFHGYSGPCPKPPLPKPAAEDPYDRGRRDMLNAILALNPHAAKRLHDIRHIGEDAPPPFTNTAGQIPFDVVFWVTEVADQLGIKSLEELAVGGNHDR